MSNGQPPQSVYVAPPQPPQPNYVVQPTQLPQPSYTIQNQPKAAERKIRAIPGIKYFAIATMTIAFLMCILGIVAIVIEAEDAYVGNGIWTGVFFVLSTGSLGLTAYWKKTSLCTNIFYLVMCIITTIVCFQLLVYSSINAVREWIYCDPFPGYTYHWYQYDYEAECQFAPTGRIAVDSLLALLAFGQMVVCVISLSLTCYGTFDCCYYCCRPTPPAVIQYTAQNGACQLVSVGGYQSPTAQYQPVSLMVPAGQGGQMMSTGYPVMPNQQMQSQPMMIPPSPAQIAMMPQGTPPVINHTATANGATVSEKQAIPPSESSQQQQQQQHPQSPVSYGQTASDEFHDEKNLLETV